MTSPRVAPCFTVNRLRCGVMQGYQGLDMREDSQGKKVRVNNAMRPGKRRGLDINRELHVRSRMIAHVLDE